LFQLISIVLQSYQRCLFLIDKDCRCFVQWKPLFKCGKKVGESGGFNVPLKPII